MIKNQKFKQNEETNVFQMKEQDKNLRRKKKNKTEISNLPDKEFKVTVIKLLAELRRTMEEHSENFNKDL